MAKGIGMILVMFGHASFPKVLTTEIFTFHVPLFFFISGYIFFYPKYKNYKEFVKKKIISLAIPYFTLSLINYLF